MALGGLALAPLTVPPAGKALGEKRRSKTQRRKTLTRIRRVLELGLEEPLALRHKIW
jgi:hypothetical protein